MPMVAKPLGMVTVDDLERVARTGGREKVKGEAAEVGERVGDSGADGDGVHGSKVEIVVVRVARH